MIPRPRITEKLEKKIIQELQDYSSRGYELLTDESVSPKQKAAVKIEKSNLRDLSERVNFNDSTPLRDDLRYSKAVEAFVQEDDSAPDEIPFGEFMDNLERIVASHSSQKQYIAQKLRSFASLIGQVKKDDPISWQKVKLFQEEERERRSDARGENLAQEFNPGDEYKGVLRGLITNDTTRAQLELVLNDASQKVSERVRKEKLQNNAYIPLLVLGAGVHSAVFTSELMRSNPELARNAVVIEPRKVLGGQFRDVGGAGYFMNSRVRAQDYSDPDENLPGKKGNINTFGRSAPLQLPDVEGRVYSDNARFGLVAAMNSYLTADTALGMEVVKVSNNRGRGARGRGRYAVELRDVETGAQTTITTDCVVSASGLGVPTLPFDETDPGTKKVLEKREQDYLVVPKGDVPGLPRVATSEEFWKFASNTRNWQSLVELAGQEIIIVGDGDSAKTILEKLNGIVPENSLNTATSLQVAAGRYYEPINITLVGAKSLDTESYVKKNRLRYAQAGLFFPRKDNSRENATITPIAGKATKLQRVFNRTRVLYVDENGVERETGSASLVITGTGFKDTTSEIFSDFADTSAGKEFVTPNFRQILEGLSRVGTVFEYEVPGSFARATITILATDFDYREGLSSVQFSNKMVRFSIKTPQIRFPENFYSMDEFLTIYRNNILSVKYPPGPVDPFYVLEKDDRPVGRQLYKDGGAENIFVVGVAAKRAFTEKEKESYPDATKKAVEILVNVDAAWRWAEGTALVAREYVTEALENVNWQSLVQEQDETRVVSPEQLGMPSGEKQSDFIFSLGTSSDQEPLPANIDSLAFLKETLARKLATWRLDSKDAALLKNRYEGEITLTFIRTFQDSYALVVNPPIYPTSVLKEVFTNLNTVQGRDTRRAIRAALREQGSQDDIRATKDNVNLQRVVRYSPSLSLTFEYDGKKYTAIGSKRKTVDLLKNAPVDEQGNPRVPLVVNYGFSRDNESVESNLFGNNVVPRSVDTLVRSLLTGESAKVEAAPRNTQETGIDALRKELGVTATSKVNLFVAKKLFEAGALIYQDFFSLLRGRVLRGESFFAVTDFEELFKEPFTLQILPVEKAQLIDLLTYASRQSNITEAAFANWSALIDRVKNEL